MAMTVLAVFQSLFSTGPRVQKTCGVVASSYALPKALIATFQLIFGAITLTNTRGDQISKFGYASFGLTVAIYTVMAFINLVGHLLTPDYSMLFIVQNEVLGEILGRPDLDIPFADGVVGRLIPADDEYRRLHYQPRQIFHGKFTIDPSQDSATFEIASTADGLPSQPWTLFPPRTPGQGSPVVQIPACPLFKRKLQLYDTNASPSIARRLSSFAVLPETTEEEAAPRPQLKSFNGLAVFGTSSLFCWAGMLHNHCDVLEIEKS
jgi:hypothetical protein